MNKPSGLFTGLVAVALFGAMGLSALQNRVIAKKNEDIAGLSESIEALSKRAAIEGLYDPGSGNVYIRVDGNNDDIRTLAKLCPQSRSF